MKDGTEVAIKAAKDELPLVGVEMLVSVPAWQLIIAMHAV